MSTTEKQLDAVREKLSLAGGDAHRRCLQLQGARASRAQLYQEIISPLQSNLSTNPPDQRFNVFAQLNGSKGPSFAAACALVAEMEKDLLFADAEKLVAPLLAEISRLEEQLVHENHLAAQARAKRQAEIDAAKQAAIEKIEAQYAATPAEPTEPAAPFRGRVKVG